MVRSPCCEKMGLKKGPWTREEDEILIHYIALYGHGNWRALPKQAGLLRCGKSCRLRWTNYLRPDIKRGDFSKDEEDTIMRLHGVLGNRWSAIAARLPGRTDNEIKNVWHTHLKKRLNQIPGTKHNPTGDTSGFESKPLLTDLVTTKHTSFDDHGYLPSSPQRSLSEISSVTATTDNNRNVCMNAAALDNLPAMDENFWLDVFMAENSGVTSDFPAVHDDHHLQFPASPIRAVGNAYGYNLNVRDGMDLWYDVFTRNGDIPEFV
ncbi:hypothetical protein RJ639_009617 [Escallonia herrerae]|uniref:Uncharacterized protein n=1 Tax=Escallonia herrerae TaxID=1293975 RepID=A0AA88US76_9ASTE|nr:hypothetical protein RJ639_024809 [Escallonia herrerae]KAK3014687.1 hypothetical protein RJ639_009617 [Escallonia herrerae]